MGAVVTAIRLIALGALGLSLAGCGTFIPFQKDSEVIVRVGDRPSIYPVRAVAGAYASPALLATLAYYETPDTTIFGDAEKQAKLRLSGWRRVPLLPYKCQPGHICAGEVGEQLWIKRGDKSCQAVIVFRGTVASSIDDWIANFHWLHRMTPIDDYYDQARGNIKYVVGVAEKQGCGGNIIAVGHSLGGGLAQHVAYAHPKIRTVYAFDPSFVVGSTDFNLLGLPIHREGRKFDYVYEHGEILAFLRFIGRQFHPYEPCNPRIRTVRFNTLSGSIINQHRIVDFTKKLVQLAYVKQKPEAKSDAPTPVPVAKKKFDLRAGCPATI